MTSPADLAATINARRSWEQRREALQLALRSHTSLERRDIEPDAAGKEVVAIAQTYLNFLTGTTDEKTPPEPKRAGVFADGGVIIHGHGASPGFPPPAAGSIAEALHLAGVRAQERQQQAN